MIKKHYYLILIFLCTTLAEAQEFQFGGKAGLTYSSFLHEDTGSSHDPYSFRIGYFFGGFAEYKVTSKFSFQTELNYIKTGAKYKTENYSIQSYYDDPYINDDRYVSRNISLNYLTVPLILKLYLSEQLYINTGPQAGILLNAKIEDANISEDFTSSFQGIFGVGYQHKQGWLMEMRAFYGITSPVKDYEYRYFEDFNQLGFQLGIGYSF